MSYGRYRGEIEWTGGNYIRDSEGQMKDTFLTENVVTGWMGQVQKKKKQNEDKVD